MPFKCLSNFLKTLEMSLINCKVNLMSTWSESCIISSATEKMKFGITDTNIYFPIVTLSTSDNA